MKVGDTKKCGRVEWEIVRVLPNPTGRPRLEIQAVLTPKFSDYPCREYRTECDKYDWEEDKYIKAISISAAIDYGKRIQNLEE